MSSFQRQLNLYGFLRQNTGSDRGSYYHELFLRGRPDLPKIMIRTRVKGIGMGRTNKVEKEPDFYQMEPSLPNASKTFKNTDVEEVEAIAPSSPFSPERNTVSYPQEDTEPVFPSPPSQHWGASPTHSSRPPVQRVSPAFAPVVTPMSESGGRPLFSSDTACHSSLLLSERAASLADPRMPPPPPTNSYIYASHHHPPSSQGNTSFLEHPVRTISAHLPMIPISDHRESNFHLHPRYNEALAEGDEEDTALFEGLEFQVVDDDSLEQFESELISDGSSSSVSGSL